MRHPGKSIEAKFVQMEFKKESLIRLLQSLPGEKYLEKPDATSWSAGQAANHLYLSEKLSLAYLRKKLSYPDSVPKFHIKSWWALMVYRMIFVFKKAKAPKQINMWEGQEVLLPGELDQRWDVLRKELRAFIEEKYPQFGHHLVYNHPFAGRLTFLQMLRFFSDHIDHHTKQIKRILKKVMH